METQEFEKLKKKHAVLEKRKTENEAEIKSILKRLKDDFALSTIEEAETELHNLEKQIEEDEKKYGVLMQEIRDAVDWDSIEC